MRARIVCSALVLLITALVAGSFVAAHAQGMWVTGPLDGMNAVTSNGETSVDFDVSHNYHISYYDSNTRDLMYYGPTGLETVASAGDVGFYNSLSCRGTEISIAYWDATNDRLMFARRNGSSWDIEQVDTAGGLHCSLVVQPQLNQPGIAYYHTTGHDLRYAVKSGGSWSIQTVESNGNVGQWASLAYQEFTPYYPRIAYTKMNSLEPGQIETDHDLKYAAWNGSSWDIETVETQYVVGKHASLAIGADDANRPAIAYYRTYWSPSLGQVRHLVYAKEVTGSGTWDITTVDTDAGEFASLVIMPDRYPRISYMEYYYPPGTPESTVLKFAEWNGSSWEKTRLSVSAGTGWYSSMAYSYEWDPVVVHVDPFANTPGETGLVHLARYIECPTLVAPTLLSPENPTFCTSMPPTLTWSAVDDAVEYDVQIGSTCGSGPIYTVTDPQYVATELGYDEYYTWRVRARNVCGDDGPWSFCYGFRTEDQPPVTTALLLPADGATGVNPSDAALYWQPIPGGPWDFDVQVGTSCGTGATYQVSTPEVHVGGLEPSTTYYWRVFTWSRCGVPGPWTGCWSFTTANTGSGTDVVVEPEPGISIAFDEVTSGGETTVDTSGYNPGPDVDAYMFLGNFYDITTTATYAGEVEVCLEYDDTGMSPAQELGLRLFHLEDGFWVDITSSVDTGNNIICGTTTSLSPFGAALFMPWMADGTTPALAMSEDTVGVSWGDYDGDGDPDLYVANHAQADKVFRNDGSGVFTDVTTAPLGHTGQGSVGSWADYDNDGDKDLYLTVRGGANVLYENTDYGFVDATAPPLDDGGESHGAAWFDYDADGDLDVYVSNYYEANRLYRNDGTGAFTDVSTSPIDDAGQTSGAAIADYDDDGDPDIYITNTGAQPNRLFRNDGGGAWTDVTPGSLSLTSDSRGAAWGDYDNDGDLDLYVANGGGANQLFRNDGSGAFVDVTSGVLANAGVARGVGWQDYDNDGDLDLYIANLNSANVLIRNEGWGIFTDGTIAPLDDPGYGIGTAWADYDGDGDADLYLGNAFGPNVLFRNDLASSNHWLHVRLVGVASNHGGIGARVRVVAGVLDQIREVQCGSGYVSQGSLAAEFGLGPNASVDLVEVYWPSGMVTSINSGIGIDRVITVAEAATAAPEVPRVTRMYAPHPNPFNPRTTVTFDLAEAGPVTMRVYDSKGRLVCTILDGVPYEPGTWHPIWDGTDTSGRSVASGVYHVRFQAPGRVETKSVTLIR